MWGNQKFKTLTKGVAESITSVLEQELSSPFPTRCCSCSSSPAGGRGANTGNKQSAVFSYPTCLRPEGCCEQREGTGRVTGMIWFMSFLWALTRSSLACYKGCVYGVTVPVASRNSMRLNVPWIQLLFVTFSFKEAPLFNWCFADELTLFTRCIIFVTVLHHVVWWIKRVPWGNSLKRDIKSSACYWRQSQSSHWYREISNFDHQEHSAGSMTVCE